MVDIALTDVVGLKDDKMPYIRIKYLETQNGTEMKIKLGTSQEHTCCNQVQKGGMEPETA